jgi:hypothetical protein
MTHDTMSTIPTPVSPPNRTIPREVSPPDRTIPREVSPSDRTTPREVSPPDRTPQGASDARNTLPRWSLPDGVMSDKWIAPTRR